jgi:hypothetical protein
MAVVSRAVLAVSLTWCRGVLSLSPIEHSDGTSLLQASVSSSDINLSENQVIAEATDENVPPDAVELSQSSGDEVAQRPLRKRHRASSLNSEGTTSGTKNVVQMLNYGDVQYVTYLTMGKQTITGIIDTGSFDLVIFSHVCGSCGLAGKYDPWQSSTYRTGKLMTVQSYGSGDTYSVEAADFLGLASLEHKNQTFWEVISAKMPVLQNAAFQSIVGVGPPETPAADAWEAAEEAYKNVSAYYKNSTKPPESMLKSVKESIDAAVEVARSPTMLENFDIQTFSMCLGKKPGSDGYITWKDTTHEELPHLFVRVPILGTHTWSVALANVRLNGGDHRGDTAVGCADGCSALMDSGTSLLAVPSSIVSTFEKAVQTLQTDCTNLHELPDLVFELGGQKFYLPADAYVAEVAGQVPKYLQSFVRLRHLKVGQNDNATHDTDTGQCHILLMESFADSAHGPLWILGMPFFRRYYTSFHVGRDHDDRALYVAHAGPDCKPVPPEQAEKGPYRRRIDPSKLHVPSSVVKAATRGFVNL